MSIVIDGSIYFDRMYRKYLTFREQLIVPKTDAMLMNPISMAVDYICYTVTNLDLLLKKYSFRVIYFNVNHRTGLLKRSFAKRSIIDRRLARSFKDMLRLMEPCDVTGIYTKYHFYFKNHVKSYGIKDIDERKIGYDYNNDLPKMELAFIREALVEQNRLTADDLYYCNRLILSTLINCRVIYTDTSNIDYLKYHKARFIRNKNWRHYKRKESIINPPQITQNIYEYFNATRELPLIDCCQTNSYDLFVLTNDPFKMYIKNQISLFLDEGLLDDYVDLIDAIDKRECDESTDTNDFNTFIESIEPTEITEADINIILDYIIKRWSSLFTYIDMRKLKIVRRSPSRVQSIGSIKEYSIDMLTEII
jgi:hypothetical protein